MQMACASREEGQDDRPRAAIRRSGERGRCARLRTEPRMKGAGRGQEDAPNLVGQSDGQISPARVGKRPQPRQVERTVWAVIEHMGRRRRRLGIVICGIHPLGALDRADLDPAAARARRKRVTQSGRERRHQDRQQGHPADEPGMGTYAGHWFKGSRCGLRTVTRKEFRYLRAIRSLVASRMPARQSFTAHLAHASRQDNHRPSSTATFSSVVASQAPPPINRSLPSKRPPVQKQRQPSERQREAHQSCGVHDHRPVRRRAEAHPVAQRLGLDHLVRRRRHRHAALAVQPHHHAANQARWPRPDPRSARGGTAPKARSPTPCTPSGTDAGPSTARAPAVPHGRRGRTRPAEPEIGVTHEALYRCVARLEPHC